MPPKASKKTVEKAKNKIIEDKTFGLKNKNKSKTVQKYVQSVSSAVKGGAKKSDDPFLKKKAKEEEAERLRMEMAIFKPLVQQQKAPVGVDPKSIVCEFFKKGLCTKGDKCKFSHNLEQGRKTEKIDIYTDRRDETKEEDTIDKWDQNKLETVVSSKQTEVNKRVPTKIVCKYFLEAIEDKKYGWFWECPNGGDKCQYQHSLPPGYVLKAKKKDEDEIQDEPIPIEEIIEEERAKLTTRTPLTKELFLKWKAEKKQKKEEEDKINAAQRERDIKVGKAMRSGREMFIFNPDLFVDEDGVLDTEELEPEEDNDGPVIRLEATGTSISSTRTGGVGDDFIAYDADGNLITTKNGKDEEGDEELNKKMEGVNVEDESLFVEEDLPDVSDDEEENDPGVD